MKKLLHSERKFDGGLSTVKIEERLQERNRMDMEERSVGVESE